MSVDKEINKVKEIVNDINDMEDIVIESMNNILIDVVNEYYYDEGKELIVDSWEFYEVIQYDGNIMYLSKHGNTFEESSLTFRTHNNTTPEEREEIINKLMPLFEALIKVRMATDNYRFGIPNNIYV